MYRIKYREGGKTWVSGSGAGRTVGDFEGFPEDRRERQGVAETAGLDFAEDGGWAAVSVAAVGCVGGGRHHRCERGECQGGC